MKELIKTIGRCSVYEVSYTTKFKGCQCCKDCNCYDDWCKAGNPQKNILYSVFTGKRTHSCKTFDEALKLAIKISNQKNNPQNKIERNKR